MKRWTIALVAAQVLACAEPDVQQDFQALERLAEDFACEGGDAPDCDALEGELWTEPGMESECVRAGVRANDASLLIATCRFGRVERYLACASLAGCDAGERERCRTELLEGLRECEDSEGAVTARLLVAACRDRGTDREAVEEYFAAVSAGLRARCDVGPCPVLGMSFRSCLQPVVDLNEDLVAAYAACSTPGWQLYERCLREEGDTERCATILRATLDCTYIGGLNEEVDRCLGSLP
ncbi:MAG: hypothetical protein CMN29_07905 [Sandaracinus sp.]|nr:hypothetical protein [Sandaracinus sp.]